ncbi:hypothetical protein GUJ93_ZPchr0001g31452 [Zizania palustris]|uniref:DUF834 domain-containing protein n=1 Tax=Zizania palustris TaxID=103762 RepID=A0A8J5RQZ2_ZIZPA|nr:hypothetical protein GUJ93_ZPchr0001g31452 [Zizania palustris]
MDRDGAVDQEGATAVLMTGGDSGGTKLGGEAIVVNQERTVDQEGAAAVLMIGGDSGGTKLGGEATMANQERAAAVLNREQKGWLCVIFS